MNISEFTQLVARSDGVEAFNELSRMALADDQPARVHTVVEDGPQVVALAVAVGDAPVELAVHPDHRRRGHGTALFHALLDEGERRFWAHGDLPPSRALAASLGLDRERTLLRLHTRGPHSRGRSTPPPDVDIRPFREDDLDGLLAVNARAFVAHPEQRAMDRADFERRAATSWFDPSGLFIADRSGEIVGFNWTKVDGRVGEVYVLAVDPAHHGAGLGAALLTRGLDHLGTAGVDAIDLYVEADHARALRLYTAVGFAEAGRDVLYVSRRPAAAGPGPS